MIKVSKVVDDASAVLKLLNEHFPNYKFSTSDNQTYTGTSLQTLVTAGKSYASQIAYYHDLERESVNVIHLQLVNKKNSETLCESMGYTGNPENNRWHIGEPYLTIKSFAQILAAEAPKSTDTQTKSVIPQQDDTATQTSGCGFCLILRQIFSRRSSSVAPSVR